MKRHLIFIGINFFIFLILASCSSLPEMARDETTNAKDSLLCFGANNSTKIPPVNAKQFRDIAKHYPQDRKFGPQGQVGHKDNEKVEFWFQNESNDLVFYTFTNDAYVYFWQFTKLPKPKLVRHGLLYCAE